MKTRTNETIISRPATMYVAGSWEVTAMCRDEDGLKCVRLLGKYETLDEIPDAYLN